MALTLSEIQAATQDYWLPNSYDQYFTSNLLIYRMLKDGKKLPGGEKIRVPLEYGAPVGGAFGENTLFDTTRRDEIQAARFDWAYYYEPCTYSMKDKVQNAGPAAEVDIVMTKMNRMQRKVKWTLGEDIYGTGTPVADEKPLTGLKAMINSTTSTAYGGITEDDLPEWSPGTVTTTTEALTLTVMRKLRRDCEIGDGEGSEPSIYICPTALLDVYRGLLQPQQRLIDPNLANAGFKNMEFEGVPVAKDGMCPAGTMFALNEMYLDMQSHQDFFFHHESWMRPTNQYLFTMQVIWVGNLICKRRDAHGYHENLS